MKFIKQILIVTGCLSIIACSKKEGVEADELFGQHAILYRIEGTQVKQADFFTKNSVTVSDKDLDKYKEEKFFVSLAKKNKVDVSVNMAITPQQVQKYNQTYGTSFLSFPEKNLEITSALQIKAGNESSEQGVIKIHVTPDMKDNTPYMFAVTMTSANSVDILNTSKTLFYTVEKTVGQINKVVKLTRDEYFELENPKDIGNTFTMEGLIYIDKLRGPGDGGDSGISTFMGEEGKTLMRFGDSGVEPDHLQANGTDIGFKFKTKKWYHIALVVDGDKTIAYVNGNKTIEFSKGGRLPMNEFYIGRSYNDNRGIEARFSEIRLWKTARSAQQIKDNIYNTDATNKDLFAYWKMDEVKNNKIEDASGNGINLLLQGQGQKSGSQKITISEEENPVKIN